MVGASVIMPIIVPYRLMCTKRLCEDDDIDDIDDDQRNYIACRNKKCKDSDVKRFKVHKVTCRGHEVPAAHDPAGHAYTSADDAAYTDADA